MPPKTIREYFGPSSTGVHNNIDDLILQAELDKFAQTGTVGVDRTPEYIGGTDDIVANIALSPLLTLKRLGTVGREIIKKTGLRNPVSHFTRGESAKNILESGTIKGAGGAFPGKPFKRDSNKAINAKIKELEERGLSSADELQYYVDELIPGSPAVSVTRDPMFLERPHKHVGTDIRFVMDRDDLLKKGMKIQPFSEPYFRKTLTESFDLDHYKEVFGKYAKQMNPKFEFEERVRGYIPTESVKLIDLIQLPRGMSNKSKDLFEMLDVLNKSKIPIIKSPLAKERLGKINPNDVRNEIDYNNIMKLLLTPTYPNSPI